MSPVGRFFRRSLATAGHALLDPRKVFTAEGRGSLRQRIDATLAPAGSNEAMANLAPIEARVARGAPPTLQVLVPSLERVRLTGGPNTALIIAAGLARRGVPVRFVATNDPLGGEGAVRDHLAELTGAPLDGHAVSFASVARERQLDFGAHDVFFATAWWTAHVARATLPQLATRELIYLVQELEPFLYPWSVFWKLAMDTYDGPIRAVVNERFVLDYLAENRIGRFAEPAFRERCAVFEPAIDAKVFHPRPRQAGARRRLLFYARAQAPRNLYEWGIPALRRAVAAGAFPAAEWDLVFMGDRLEPVDLGHGQTIRQHPWQGYRDYAGVLGTSDVGLSLMLSPHTSYPPLEMAASGMRVVTNAFATKTKAALAALSPDIIAVDPEPDAIVAGLVEAARRATAGPASATLAMPRSWDAALEPTLSRIEAMFREIATAV